MTFVHEFGHVIFGLAMGGELTLMQIAWLKIYPQIAFAPYYALGYVIISGLESDFANGLMGLGGSLTTNLVAWVIALIMVRIKFRRIIENGLKFLGLFGILDLPFYVVLPQVGLQHWFFLGGSEPEPLLSARLMGISDPAFYLLVALSTFGLLFYYYRKGFLYVLSKEKKLK